MYAKIQNGAVVKYPYTFQDFAQDYPNVDPGNRLPPLDELPAYGVVPVVVAGAPDYDATTHTADPNGCAYNPQLDRWETAFVIRPLTSEEIEAKASEIRSQRNNRLSRCDWTQVLDAQVDRTAWAAYRQALRDITTQSGFPFSVVWPQEPA